MGSSDEVYARYLHVKYGLVGLLLSLKDNTTNTITIQKLLKRLNEQRFTNAPEKIPPVTYTQRQAPGENAASTSLSAVEGGRFGTSENGALGNTSTQGGGR